MIIGPLHSLAAEIFQISLCTVEALKEFIPRDHVVICRHFVFVMGINTERVECFLRDRIERIGGSDWPQVEKIARRRLSRSLSAYDQSRPAKLFSPGRQICQLGSSTNPLSMAISGPDRSDGVGLMTMAPTANASTSPCSGRS